MLICRQDQRRFKKHLKGKHAMSKHMTRDLILIGIFASLTAVGAFIKIPMWPVSITLQFMMTAFAGLLLGGSRAAASQLVYVMIGLIGIPVFTEGGGLGYLLRPSFGFLVGLIPAAYVIGKLSQRRNDLFGYVLACLSGLAVLYCVGVPYMYLAVRTFIGSDITVRTAVYSGMIVFLPGDILKIIICSVLSMQVHRRASRILR
jgi:biotin transport system substrate-specific component